MGQGHEPRSLRPRLIRGERTSGEGFRSGSDGRARREGAPPSTSVRAASSGHVSRAKGDAGGTDPASAPRRFTPFSGRTLNGYNLGASAIWLIRPSVNFMFEALAVWNEELTETGSENRTYEMLLSPGIRWAPYTSGDTQWVLGIGLPIGVSRDAPDISLFFYLSIEHPFKQRAAN